jgi:hypothetical protein
LQKLFGDERDSGICVEEGKALKKMAIYASFRR